jgi:hypothetical protein
LQSNALNAVARVAPTASSTATAIIFLRQAILGSVGLRTRHSFCRSGPGRAGTSLALRALAPGAPALPWFLPSQCGMNTRIAWLGDSTSGTQNAVLFNKVLWSGLCNLDCEVNKK